MFKFSKRQKDFHGALKQVLDSEQGQKLFKYLKEEVVDGSSMGRDTHETYYRLGQADLIKGLFRDARMDENMLEHIKTIDPLEE